MDHRLPPCPPPLLLLLALPRLSPFKARHLFGDIIPHRTMGTAVPATPTGVPFIPPTAAIPPNLRSQIIAATPYEPLFMNDAGIALTSSWFCAKLRCLCQHCGLPPERYTAHSFRIGAATMAAPKVPMATLKAMGRWSSAAFEHYIRLNTKHIMQAQKIMSI
ncbi:hypothetical protein SKAU_G00062790 [Synaphobranchus kaupii]|uniref:Tyr recombinase domain-containing protein n=1 Tax=Synaphobranchus kaupii TaxID=118154 RepID=A0A9Q1G6D4_SYNKA|nr:hypothetical protein SKAU_G00062790 [Synaphobranchus kaupii]